MNNFKKKMVMKNISKILYLGLISLFLFSSCAEKPLVKGEVEKGFSGSVANMPTLSITGATLEPVKGQIVTCTGTITTTGEIREVGFAYAKKADFSDKKTATGKLTGTTFTANITLEPLTQYYIKAYGIVNEGAAESEGQKSVTTPDLPFYDKVLGNFKGNMKSAAYGTAYNGYTISLLPYSADLVNKVIVAHTDPYYFGKGYKYPKNNFVIGTIDATNKTVTVTAGAQMTLGTFGVVAVNSDKWAGATKISNWVLTFIDNVTFKANAWGTYDLDSNEWDDQYELVTNFKK